MLSAFWPDRCTILAKKEILLYTGPFGIAAWLCGCVFIDRGNQQKAHLTISKVTEKMVEKKLKIFIFPEGTRSCGTTLHQFKKGAFHLAIDAQIPIVPVVISSYLPFLDPKRKHFDFEGHVTIRCLPPVSTVGLEKKDVTELCNRVQNSMTEVFVKTVPSRDE
jgi:lysophosphatidate acyltransferase